MRSGHSISSSIHPLWQLVFYLVPIALLVIVSFWATADFQPVPAFRWQNYHDLVCDAVYRQGLLSSLRLAAVSSTLAVMLALPMAFALTFTIDDKLRKYAVFFLLWPFFSNYVTRMFSLQLWLNDQGILNSVLLKLGIVKEPIKLLYSEAAVVCGLLAILVPISAMIIYLSLTRFDRDLLSAAINLGATRRQAFVRVSFPFALPGVLAAFMYSFIVSIGDFVCPRILGGNQVYTLSILIEDRMKVNDWPLAAALGVVMMLTSLFVMVMILYFFTLTPTARFARRRRTQS